MIRKFSSVALAILAVAACDQSPTQPEGAMLDGPVADAQDPYEADGGTFTTFTGGGFIKGGSDSHISFGGETDTSIDGAETTDMVIQFHSVDDPDVDGRTFKAISVGQHEFFDNDSPTCVAAANVYLTGTLDGEPGFTVIYRAGDSGKIKDNDVEDTVRFQVFNGSAVASNEIYDTFDDAAFGGGSSCVGTARTNLDGGNVNLK